jgi:hypothetical protein
VLLREVVGVALRFLVEDEVDATLAVERDLLRAVACDRFETERVEHGLEYARLRGSKFDELEAVETHGVFEQVRHGSLLLAVKRDSPTFCAIYAHDVSFSAMKTRLAETNHSYFYINKGKVPK